LDVKAVNKIVNELNDANHPLVEVIIETVNNRKTIVNKILEYSVNNYYNTGTDPKNSPHIKSACDLKEMISKLDRSVCGDNCDKCCEDIKKYIEEKVPENFRNKFRMSLTTGGLNGLYHTVHPICESNSHFMAFVFYELTGTLFLVQNQTDYQLQERIFSFIEYLKFVIQNGFDFSDNKLTNLQNSAQKVLIKGF
jgi:hypothetical protein